MTKQFYHRTLYIGALLFAPIFLFAQNKKEEKQQFYANTAVVEGDTIPYVTLREAEIVQYSGRNASFKKRYDWTKRYVLKVYPYAKLATEIISEYETEVSKLDKKRYERKFRNQVEKDLKEEFGDDLKHLTIIQGQMLIKLLDRETSRTGYDIVKDIKGGVSAFMWQGVARLFGSNLKAKYEPKGEDALIEMIVKQIERGELAYVPLKRKTAINTKAITGQD